MSNTGADAVTPTTTEALRSSERWRLTLRPVVVFLLSRVGVMSVVGATALTTRRTVMTHLVSWDSKWYLMIAQRGYVHAIPPGTGNRAQSDLGFFPLLPLMIRGMHAVTGFGFSVSGLLTTTSLGLLAAIAVWWMLYEVFGRGGADRGTALVFLSPAAFVFSMVYSEGAIILFVASSLLALHHRRWLVAGLCAALATAADPVGCAAVVPCVVAAVLAVRSRGEWRAIVAPLVAPLGVGLFFGYLWVHTGSPLTWFRAQRAGWQGGAFGNGVPTALTHFLRLGVHDVNSGVKTLSALAAIGMLVYFVRSHPPRPWVGYVFAVVAMGIASPIIGITPRLLLRSFPLFGVVGARLPPLWFEAILTISTMCLCALTIASGNYFWTP